MQDWITSSKSVREQSDGLKASAESARGILEAMRQCNAALDAKLNSQRWRSELERGEAVAVRLEQGVASARSVVQRLEALLADFETARGQLDAWERRQKQADESAARLARLIAQSQTLGQHIERSVDARQRLIAAMAKNTSQLADVIQAARVADQARSPALSSATRPSAVADDRTDATPHGRIDWARLHTALNTK
jgi:hypothetical protein